MIKKKIEEEMRKLSSRYRVEICKKFFKTGRGEYGEGDIFMGVTVPDTRKVLKRFLGDIEISNAVKLIQSKYHEIRLLGFLALVEMMKKAKKQGDKKSEKKIFETYIENAKRANSWDLVDISAKDIVGSFLADKNRAVLYRLVKSKNMWERRISVISSWYFIKNGDPSDTLKICGELLNDKEDLMHKACGWMLREVGKFCGLETLNIFLEKNSGKLPRTMLRCAIEKHNPVERAKFLARK